MSKKTKNKKQQKSNTTHKKKKDQKKDHKKRTKKDIKKIKTQNNAIMLSALVRPTPTPTYDYAHPPTLLSINRKE